MAKTEYPGVAQLVAHVIWVHGAERSNRSTRTKSPLKSVDFRGLFFAYCGANKTPHKLSLIDLVFDMVEGYNLAKDIISI